MDLKIIYEVNLVIDDSRLQEIKEGILGLKQHMFNRLKKTYIFN